MHRMLIRCACGWSVSVSALSSTTLRTPYFASSSAVVSPVGPPPAMITGASLPLGLPAAVPALEAALDRRRASGSAAASAAAGLAAPLSAAPAPSAARHRGARAALLLMLLLLPGRR